MPSVRRVLGACMVTGSLVLGGCAPVVSTWGVGPGLQLAISPTGSPSLLNPACAWMNSPGLGSPMAGTSSAAATVMARRPLVNRVQARFQLGQSSTRGRMEGWKALAGGC